MDCYQLHLQCGEVLRWTVLQLLEKLYVVQPYSVVAAAVVVVVEEEDELGVHVVVPTLCYPVLQLNVGRMD